MFHGYAITWHEIKDPSIFEKVSNLSQMDCNLFHKYQSLKEACAIRWLFISVFEHICKSWKIYFRPILTSNLKKDDQEFHGDCDVGDFIMVTVSRCLLQNDYVGVFFKLKISMWRICHQHKQLSTSVINIIVTAYRTDGESGVKVGRG